MSNFEIALSIIVLVLLIIFCVQQYCIVLLSELYNKEVENSDFWRNATFYHLNKPTMNEKIKKVAEWDGWTFRNNGNTAEQYENGELMRGCHDWQNTPTFSIHKYLTDLNWLIPVARKVYGELRSKESRFAFNAMEGGALSEFGKRSSMFFKNGVGILSAMLSEPTNNKHTDLLNAVYDGILLIEKYKSDDKEAHV